MHKTLYLILLSVMIYQGAYAQVAQKQISVHDPVMIREKGIYYLFSTGVGIKKWSSHDMKNWKPEPPVFNKAPEWAVEKIPGFKGHIWAPDVTFYKGLYYLYYSVSVFGKNTSAIGVATNSTLNSADPGYKWIDHGEVIGSAPGKDNWNAIDPNFITDKNGKPYLSFGSFWSGLKLVALDNSGKSIVQPDKMVSIASRNVKPKEVNPIEAPFIYRKGNWFYLFASIDYCCKGKESTYKIIVGRSKTLKGPYLDKNGVDLKRGGGTIVQAGDEDWYGVGHNAVCGFDGKDYLIYHGYDAKDKGNPKLIVKALGWEKDWPIAQ